MSNVTTPCPICSTLGDDITVNTGREERFPEAFSKLIKIDQYSFDVFYRCPECNTYFEWIDLPQMYGSGNNWEERLVRQTPERSLELDKKYKNK